MGTEKETSQKETSMLSVVGKVLREVQERVLNKERSVATDLGFLDDEAEAASRDLEQDLSNIATLFALRREERTGEATDDESTRSPSRRSSTSMTNTNDRQPDIASESGRIQHVSSVCDNFFGSSSLADSSQCGEMGSSLASNVWETKMRGGIESGIASGSSSSSGRSRPGSAAKSEFSLENLQVSVGDESPEAMKRGDGVESALSTRTSSTVFSKELENFLTAVNITEAIVHPCPYGLSTISESGGTSQEEEKVGWDMMTELERVSLRACKSVGRQGKLGGDDLVDDLFPTLFDATRKVAEIRAKIEENNKKISSQESDSAPWYGDKSNATMNMKMLEEVAVGIAEREKRVEALDDQLKGFQQTSSAVREVLRKAGLRGFEVPDEAGAKVVKPGHRVRRKAPVIKDRQNLKELQ